VQQARAQWKREQPQLKAERLVFLDETAATIHMTRLRGRSPRDKRCVAAAPQGHRKTTIFIAGLRHDAVTAPLAVDGPMNGASFAAYLQTSLCPTLRAGDIVVADNLSCHKIAGVREAIKAIDATIRYLPPYSPDLNPIEKMFSKLKALLCKAAIRTVEALWDEIGRLMGSFPLQECSNYFASSVHVRK
jgi:transposase